MTEWIVKEFKDLSLQELYSIFQLRMQVFIVEQNCPYQDADNKDQFCHHLMGWVDGTLAAYIRIVSPGISYSEPSIGRVVTSSRYRATGLGKSLMQKGIETTRSLYGEVPIRIGAQLYLQRFYESFGFKKQGEIYLEDGIQHVEMVL